MKQQNKQLSLFEVAPELATPKQKEEPLKSGFDSDYLMAWLERTNKESQKQLDEITQMLAYVQQGWTEEEKLHVNNPKEYYRLQKLKQQEEPKMAKELTSQAVDTLKNCKVEGNVVKLPAGQLDRKVYVEVKDRLELIGGKWKSGKIAGFVFEEDPTDLLAEIAGGGIRNIKKEFQFFGTPDDLADRLVEHANLKRDDIILEPSAGQGAIVKAIQRAQWPGRQVWGYELMPLNQKFLDKIVGFRLLGNDFLEEVDTYFNKIIANPPFNKNQDIIHIRKMYSMLLRGGCLVSMASNHWQESKGKKETEFREWLKSVNATVIQVEAGAFKESGTNVSTCIIIIDRP